MFIYEGTPSSDSFRPEPAMVKMENTNSYNSIKSRQRNILGTFSFLPPLVPDDGIVANTAAPEKGQPPKRRKQQILRAQRYVGIQFCCIISQNANFITEATDKEQRITWMHLNKRSYVSEQRVIA